MGSVDTVDLSGQTPFVLDDSLHYVPEPCLHVSSPHQFLDKLDGGSPLEEVR